MTAKQKAATERAMAGLDAEADLWLADAVEVRAARDLVVEATPRMLGMSPAAAAPFIKRQHENIDALIRLSFSEGFYLGGESRRAYDEARKGESDGQ